MTDPAETQPDWRQLLGKQMEGHVESAEKAAMRVKQAEEELMFWRAQHRAHSMAAEALKAIGREMDDEDSLPTNEPPSYLDDDRDALIGEKKKPSRWA